MNVIVLNADYTYLSIVNWRRAIALLYKKKVEIVEATEKIIKNAEKTIVYKIPKVIRLVNFVSKIYKSIVHFSKHSLFIRDNFTCCYCLASLDKHKCTVDHILPKSRGGKTSWENCVCACSECNNKKDRMTPDEIGMTLKKTPKVLTLVEYNLIKMKQLDFDIYK